jgi:hypothetical protein
VVCALPGATLASFVAQGWAPPHADAGWRGAMAHVRNWEQGRPAPLLVQTGFIEGARVTVLRDPKWQEFLYAPALYYPHAGPTYVLPYWLRKRQQPYFDEVSRRVAGQRFSMIVYAPSGGESSYVQLLATRHGPARLLGRVRRLDVYAFGPP